MEGWTTHDGLAVALDRADIDTDQLIPARFMSRSRSEGYGDHLFHDLRASEADFPLNRHPDATVLIAGPNFGCGSSREAAVYALVDAGFRAIVAPGFADIFAGNAVNNGLLTITLPEAADIATALGDGTAPAAIDLELARLTVKETSYTFDLPDIRKKKLSNGWDDIDLTREHTDEIEAFAARRRRAHAWSWPSTDTTPA